MKVENKNVVAVSYELRLNSKEGDIVDSADAKHSLNFIYGTGAMLPKFEENLSGLVADSSFEFKLTSEEGYGNYSDQNISEVPMDVFKKDDKIEDGLLEIGNVIPLQDNQGNHFNGKVLEKTETNVKLDFNHPLAGQDLFFAGKIISIREATAEEISHGHVHQPHHHEHGGEGCDGNCNH